MNVEDLPTVCLIPEVAAVLRHSVARTHDLCRRGIIPSFKQGNNYRILKSALVEYMNNVGGKIEGAA
jgi:hypothetical protein